MRKRTVIIISLALVAALAATGTAFYRSNQPAQAQATVATTQTSNEERQKQLKDWQNKVDMWNANEKNKAMQQDQTKSLPNAGPGQQLTLFAVIATVAAAAYSLANRWVLNRD